MKYKVKHTEDRWGHEETLERSYIEGGGYGLFDSDYVIRPDCEPVDDYIAAAERAVENRLRKQLRERFRHRTLNVSMEIDDKGAYGHTSRIYIVNVSEHKHDQVMEAACALLNDPNQEYEYTIYEQTNEWTCANGWVADGSDLYDLMLKDGYVLDQHSGAVLLADASLQEISEHIAGTSDPEGNRQRYLFKAISATA